MAVRWIALVFAGLLDLAHSRQAHKVDIAQRHADEQVRTADSLENVAALLLATHPSNSWKIDGKRKSVDNRPAQIHRLGQRQRRASCVRCQFAEPDDFNDNDFFDDQDDKKSRKEAGFLGAIAKFMPSSYMTMSQMLMASLAAAFAAQSYAPTLLTMGARVNSLIAKGQWHRLVTPVLLQASWHHLLANVLAVWRIGSTVENAFGKSRSLFLFLATGLIGNLAGFWLGNPLSETLVAASGAVFGIVGAALGYVARNWAVLSSPAPIIKKAVGVLIVYTFFGAKSPEIDTMAHIGGLASGLLLGFLLAPPDSGYTPSANSGGYDEFGDDDEDEDMKALVPKTVADDLLKVLGALYLVSIGSAVLIANPR